MNFFDASEKRILQDSKKIVVAFSGGADSTLSLLATIANTKDKSKITALHINHKKSKNSDLWEMHCKDFCDTRKINFISENVEINVKGQGFEAAARNERRKIFQHFPANTSIILGHHADDQVETILFSIFRGTALKGLSGMGRVQKHNHILLIRPLLNISKDQILNYLEKDKVSFVEDESNDDDGYSRNYIRKNIVPLIKSKWTGFEKNISRMTRLAREQNALYEAFIREELTKVSEDQNLSLSLLKKYDPFLRSELIRLWLADLSYAVPNESQMKEIQKSFFESRQDSNPVIKFNRDDDQSSGVIISKVNKFLIAEATNE